MEQTANYGLNQWDAGDRIMVEDFNADNAKVDQALGEQEAALAEHTAALALRGNCQIWAGSYVGAGSYGAERRRWLPFHFLRHLSAFTATDIWLSSCGI